MVFQFRPFLTLVVAPAIIVLLGLSVWQVQRLQWKEALLSEIGARMTSSPIALTSEFRALPNYQAVTATGRFLRDENLYVIGQSHEGRSGVRVFTPFETNLGQLIWVDRGWSPDKEHSLNVVPIRGQLAIAAVLKEYREQQGAFKGGNDPASELWFIVNPEEMSAHRGLEAVKTHYLQLAKPISDSAVPLVLPPTTNIRNSHFQYALIWLSLAISLLTIYMILSLRRPSNLDETKG
jgi:surfeit locus 1 family protein